MKKKALFTLIPALLALSLATAPTLAAAIPILNYSAQGFGKGYIVTPGAIYYGTQHGDLVLDVNFADANDILLFTLSSPIFEWTVTNWHYAGNMLIMSAVPGTAIPVVGGVAGPCPIIIMIQLKAPYYATVIGLKVFFTGNIAATYPV